MQKPDYWRAEILVAEIAATAAFPGGIALFGPLVGGAAGAVVAFVVAGVCGQIMEWRDNR